MDDGKIPILPYTRYTRNKKQFKPWEYTYDQASDTYTYPLGEVLSHITTDYNGKRTCRTIPARCRDCPCKAKCGTNEKGQKAFQRHIWQEYLDVVEGLRKTEGEKIYARRKQNIEHVFAGAKEKHVMKHVM